MVAKIRPFRYPVDRKEAMAMTLGQRIQELRKQKGLSQEALGEALGVSRQAVSKWEGDNGIPELDTLIAMSRLFGVTVGQLLGVEEAPAREEAPGEPDRTEEILRRYAEAVKPAPSQKSKAVAALAGAAVGLALLLLLEVNSLQNTVDRFRSDLSSVKVQVSNTQSNLSSQIRNTIYAVLSEEAQLLSTFQWSLAGLDLQAGTATLQLDATMKQYAAGSRLQFQASWKTVDQAEGRTAGDWADGPDFFGRLTLPLNYSTQISIRVQDKDGNIQEQQVADIYSLHPDNFQLWADSITTPFAITTKGFGMVSMTSKGEWAGIHIMSTYPEYIRPEKAVLTAWLNGQQVFSEEMTLTFEGEGKDNGDWLATIKDDYFDITMKNGDRLTVRLTVTDSLGRTQQFDDAVGVQNGNVERTPAAAPAIPAG